MVKKKNRATIFKDYEIIKVNIFVRAVVYNQLVVKSKINLLADRRIFVR